MSDQTARSEDRSKAEARSDQTAMFVVATAGHVDHGKSTLVRALTGTDPDRFAEEKERGLTIDLGFAWTTLASGRELAFVDVPGHVRFIKNMLAGVGAVAACLFVVAATEGWKPQSEEHLRILELLGIDQGVIALTKVGLVDDETRELARLDLAEHLEGTFLATADVAEVDVPAGIGVDGLRAALDRLLASVPLAADVGRPRLWVDRVFAAKGSGTVVTGTLAGGSLAIDDELVVLPGATRVRVRGLQSLKETHERVGPGSRVAVNLSGIARDQLARGSVIVRPREWHVTRTIDASLHVLDSLDHEVSRKGAYQAYVGSGEHPVSLRVLPAGSVPERSAGSVPERSAGSVPERSAGSGPSGAEGVFPGEEGFVRLHLPRALPLMPGDRFVLRESGRGETVGGGEVLDVSPVLAATKARPSRSVDRVVAERGWIDAATLERLTGERRPSNVGRWVVDEAVAAADLARLGEAVEAAGPLGLDAATLDERQRALLPHLDGVAVAGGRVRRAGAIDPLAGHPFVAALQASLFSPPDPGGVDRGELRELVRRSMVVERDGLYFAPEAVEAAAHHAAVLLAGHPEGFTVAQARDALGATRKHVLPLLAILDSTGVTRRRGDLRVAGPRLPAP